MTGEEYRAPPAELRRLLAASEGYAAIGRLHGVPENVVRYRCRELGLRERVNGRRPNEAGLRLALRHADIPLSRIAEAFGCRDTTIRAAARAYGLPTDILGREKLRDAR